MIESDTSKNCDKYKAKQDCLYPIFQCKGTSSSI